MQNMIMLSEQQIKTLVELHGGESVYHHDRLVSIIPNKKDRNLIFDYNEFKQKMGLNDIRFHWMLSDTIYMSGGAVLAWIWPHAKNEDYDFYFKNKNAASAFENLINSYGCKRVKRSSISDTYEYKGTIIQLIGINETETKDYYGQRLPLKWFSEPSKIMDRFDFNVSKFAVDSDHVYTTSKAIESLLTRSLTLNVSNPRSARVDKYLKKGFILVEGTDYENVSNKSWY